MAEVKTITIQGKVHHLPPLNTGQVRRHWPALAAIIQSMDASDPATMIPKFGEMVDSMAALVLAALQNQYPKLTMEDLDCLTIPELQEAIQGVIEATGMGGKPKGEVKAPRSR